MSSTGSGFPPPLRASETFAIGKPRVNRTGALLLVAGVVTAGSIGVSSFRHRNARLTWSAKASNPDARELDPSGKTLIESMAVEKAVALLSSGSRAAGDQDALDNQSRRDLEALYADYHPYFVRGDLNGDGRIDFAQAFISRKNGGLWFDVAVFFGKADGSFSEPVFVEKGITLAPGDLSIERSILILTPDVARDEARRWRYEPQDRRFVEADTSSKTTSDPDADADAPDETPDDKPRARI